MTNGGISQQEINTTVLDHKTAIANMQGQWDSLATKEFVHAENAKLKQDIQALRDWRNRLIGFAALAAFGLAVLVNIIVAVATQLLTQAVIP